MTRHPTSRSSRSAHIAASRRESKELTRQALLRAALKLLSRHSFDSISLREVTRQAGVSPTAFYRHFDDMEELGLVLVEESFGQLRQMVRDARSDPLLGANAIRGSVEVVAAHAIDHRDHLRFVARERYGGVRRLRRAIRREMQLFADELAVDLAELEMVRSWTLDDRRMVAGLVAETLVHMTFEGLDATDTERDALIGRTEAQLRLIWLGVPYFRSVDDSAEAEGTAGDAPVG